MPERLAVISDVHGNLTALEAVLADIEARGITRVFNLGDVVGKGPRGAECIDLCRRRCELTVRGNWDAFISRDETQLWGGAQWTRDQLGADELAWLAALPSSHDLVVGGRPVRFFHASNISEFHRVRYHHTDEQFAAMFTNTDFTGDGPVPLLVGYGDIHSVYLEVDLGRTLFNAGSLGNALDAPDAPYVILEGDTGDVGNPGEPGPPVFISFVRVAYDVEAEIAVARRLGMPDAEAYALELRDQLYRGAVTPPQ